MIVNCDYKESTIVQNQIGELFFCNSDALFLYNKQINLREYYQYRSKNLQYRIMSLDYILEFSELRENKVRLFFPDYGVLATASFKTLR